MFDINAVINTINARLSTSDIESIDEKLWKMGDYSKILNSIFESDEVYASSAEEEFDHQFCKLLKPFEGLEKSKKIYCKCHKYESDDGIEYSFSALTDEMIDVDARYYSGKAEYWKSYRILMNMQKECHNFNYNFVEEYYENGYKKLRLKQNQTQAQNQEQEYNLQKYSAYSLLFQNTNFVSVLDLLYKPYCYNFVLSDESQAKEIEQIAGEDWWEVTVYSKENKEHKNPSNSTVFQGRLVYAASPMKFEDVEAEWIKKANKSVFTKLDRPIEYPIAIKSNVDEVLNNVFNKVSDSKITVFRVGEANAVLIKNTVNGETRNIVFDLGMPNDCNFYFFREAAYIYYETYFR